MDLSQTNDQYRTAERFAEVQAAIGDRARRREYICSEVLTEPAWDILLQLYAYNLVGEIPPLNELTDRINVPSTTSIRWIKMLEAEGLVVREADPGNPAAVRAHLTTSGLSAMTGYFSKARSHQRRTGW
jgi:DNA-binding MarR family transcriptional regulator